MSNAGLYSRLIQCVFETNYKPGIPTVNFTRSDIIKTSESIGLDAPKNVGDVLYSFRYRQPLPDSIKNTAPKGKTWTIQSVGRSKYQFVLEKNPIVVPDINLSHIEVKNSIPKFVEERMLEDEQSFLSKIRHNKLLDLFTGMECHSLQNHLRTSVKNIGQVETDELYVGINRSGKHHIIPVQAKGGKDQISIVQIKQDVALCKEKYPKDICMPIAVQFYKDNSIYMFSFSVKNNRIKLDKQAKYIIV